MTAPRPPQPPRPVRIAYGVSDVGASLAFVAVNAWLLYLLVNAAGVPAWQAGLAFLAGRLVDAAADPAMGWLSDRVAPRIGRLIFVRIGAFPLGVVLALLFALPARGEPGAVWLAAGLFVLLSLAYTVVQVPVMALAPEIAPDYRDRTGLAAWRVAFGTLASLLATALPPALVLLGEGGGALAEAGAAGWTLAGLVLGSVVALAYSLTGWTVPEPRREPRPKTAEAPLQALREAARAPGLAPLVTTFVLITIGLTTTASVLPFFLESALLLPAAWMTPLLGGFFGIGILVFPAWSLAADRYGKVPVLVAACWILAAALALLAFLAPAAHVGVSLLLPAAVAGAALAGVLMLPWAILPDLVEIERDRSGVRREGQLAGLFTLAQKLAGSFGVFATGIAASVIGYLPNVVEQTPDTVLGLRVAVGLVAAAAFTSAGLAARWIFTDRLAAARAERGDRGSVVP